MSNQVTVRAVVVPNGTTSGQAGVTRLHLVNADGTEAGTVKKQAAQADSVASTVGGLVTDFNALLAKLRSAGVIS
jgi:hypothetical protein